MMHRVGTRRRRASLRGWTKWLPFLLFPFAVLFGETWLRVQTQRNYDYESSRVEEELVELEREIDELRHELREKEQRLESMGPARAEAEGLDLVKPDPARIWLISLEGDTRSGVHTARHDPPGIQ
ncbi:MAG TPA: hypothetical protein HPP83_06475 [Candidatus Hydrogenedentes bacterium]|nr:hypothetical protein [Candidatus Hydrogenedentota bacterium]